MLVGTSWEASWGPPGGNFEASRGLFWSCLGASCGPIGAESYDFPFAAPLWGPSWGRLQALLGRFGRLLGRLGDLLGRLGALLAASRAVLERSWGPLGPSLSVGKLKKRERQKPSKTYRKSMVFALRDSLGQPPAGFVAHLGVVSGAPWLLSGLSSGHLKLFGPSGSHIRPSRRPPRPA